MPLSLPGPDERGAIKSDGHTRTDNALAGSVRNPAARRCTGVKRMKTHSARGDDELSIDLTRLEIEAVALGLRTLLITQQRDEVLCRVATTGLTKLPGVDPSDGQWSATRTEDEMNR